MPDGFDVTVRAFGVKDEPTENVVVGFIVRVVDTDDHFEAVQRACDMVNGQLGGLHHLGPTHNVTVLCAGADDGYHDDHEPDEEDDDGERHVG